MNVKAQIQKFFKSTSLKHAYTHTLTVHLGLLHMFLKTVTLQFLCY